MVLDRELFGQVEKKLRKDPHAGLNGEADRIRSQIDLLGKTATEFKQVPDGVRAVLRRAVKTALGFGRPPTDDATHWHLRNDIYDAIDKVGENEKARACVHKFVRYVASTVPSAA